MDRAYCTDHAYLAEEARARKASYFEGARPTQWRNLYSSRRWKELSSKVLHDSPVCAKCRSRMATEVHHIIPHRGDTTLFYDPENLVGLCHDCHSEETRREARERQIDRRNPPHWS